MTWFPIAFLPPQIVSVNGPYSGGILQAYAAGTSTPIAMATDDTGATTLAFTTLNAAGNPVSSGAVFIPYIDQNYKLVLYPNAAAQASQSGAVWTVDNIQIAPPSNSAFIQVFSGDGSTTVFTLSQDLGTNAATIMVFADQPNEECSSLATMTLGTGWSYATGTATATGAISTPISQTSLAALIQGESYNVTWTMTQSAGTITPNIGGTAGTSQNSAGTYTETIVAGSSQVVQFTAAGFTGTVTLLSVHKVVAVRREIVRPADITLANTSLTLAVAPAKGTNNVLVFAPSLLFGAVGASAAGAATSATNSAASATLAQAWASQTSGIVAATDFSAKAWAVGGTGVTVTSGKGAAKEWAVTTGAAVDTTEYAAKEYAVGTTVATGSAKSWATITGAKVQTVDYSAKEYAVGTTATSAKSWATLTSASVDGVTFSAKEFAQGSQAATGGSAANWAQQTGADVTGAATHSRSAKSWSQDVLTGVTYGGSAKDWAQSASSPDGTSQSAKTYATNSATSATASAGSATTASAAAAAATAAAIGLANEWLYLTATTMTDPGTGNFKLDNATFASVANIAISSSSGDSGNPNLHTYLQTWDASNHSPRGIIRIEKNATNFILLGISGAKTDNTTWVEYPVTVIASAGSFLASDVTFINFTPYGNDGTGTLNASGSPTVGSLTKWASASTIANADLSGDVTTTGSLATSIAALAVTNAKIANSTIDLTAKVTGVLPSANGGTNKSTWVKGDILIATATNTPAALAVGTGTQVLGVSGGVPAWVAAASGGGGARVLSGTDTVIAADNGKLLTISGTCALALTAAATVGSFTCFVKNTSTSGIQVITVTPNGAESLDGTNAVLLMLPGEMRSLSCDGTAWTTAVIEPFILNVSTSSSPVLPKNGYQGISGQVWGAGGSGGKGATNGGGGGGGGAYQAFELMYGSGQLDLNIASITLAITIGAGGAAQVTANTAGNHGNPSFITTTLQGAVTGYLGYAFGGGGGGGSSLGAGGGGGGTGWGYVAANPGLPVTSGIGADAVTTTAGVGGKSWGQQVGAAASTSPTSMDGGGGGGNSTNSGTGASAFYGGAGGGAAVATTGGNGGHSQYGGGGGGGAGSTTGGLAGTTVYGGLAGAGASAGGNGGGGNVGGGGGGGCISGTQSGAGGSGYAVIVGVI